MIRISSHSDIVASFFRCVGMAERSSEQGRASKTSGTSVGEKPQARTGDQAGSSKEIFAPDLDDFVLHDRATCNRCRFDGCRARATADAAPR